MMKLLALITVPVLLASCATNYSYPNDHYTSNFKSKNQCKYIERDLTAHWQSRSYWCVPESEASTVIRVKRKNTVIEPTYTKVTTSNSEQKRDLDFLKKKTK